VFSELAELHAEVAACTKCNDAGFFAATSNLVVNQPAIYPKMMLVGQAPASPLRSKGRPFSGQAGRVLFGWLARAGFDEEDFRARCYFTAMTKCYPGPAKGGVGKGDRAPTSKEQALCRPYLLRELTLIQPKLIITVGRISMNYFLGAKTDFTQAIGQAFERDGRIVLPLPHPSGVSRWTNDPANQARLSQALSRLQEIAHEL
jgi:uracil-DNA glycosylase